MQMGIWHNMDGDFLKWQIYLFEYSSVRRFEQNQLLCCEMISSVLIDYSKLEKIAEYRLLLSEITLSLAAKPTKIALLRSLKRSLEVAVQRQNKKAQWQAIGSEWMKETGVATTRNSQQIKSMSLFLPSSMAMHRVAINKLCSQFQLRDHLSICLSQLQQQLTKVSSRFQRQSRANDYQGQARAIAAIKQVHSKMREVLEVLRKMNEEVVVEYQILTDNIKLLKVKNIILKGEVPRGRAIPARHKAIGKGDIHLLASEFIQIGNENRNQILVNL